ncbi:DUF6048 family protein [Spongiivirga citrea]|uniref:Outer membrane beta-barrel protein n=1 Tax=Spongiivirga citrea TaxID=1481457 RepID=A0A6M0CLN5_9FLAO|nr:DUF6048 family protein [Spongiivirga citrea]NER16317.1 hypothetical protein [Spongiivirga citrea]
MLRYFTSILLLLVSSYMVAQEEAPKDEETPQGELIETARDSISKKDKYGLRFGIDLGRPVFTFLDEENYTGFEIVGDFRISKKLYIAAELGNEEHTIDDKQVNFTAKGSYIKLGVDYQLYNNWYGMDNMIYIGGRYSFSTFSQTLNSFSLIDRNQAVFEENTLSEPGTEFSGLNASWLELVFGAKVELFNNFYMGASVRISRLFTSTEPDSFANLWIPGFNKVTEDSSFGVGFNYTLSYRIPIFKKDR